MTESYQIPCWAYAYGGPVGHGVIRHIPEDFIVEEQIGFDLSGSGEHAFVKIEKSGENTEYVARALAKFADVRIRDIGFAGLKDRNARTTQWFSIWLPGKPDPDWQEFTIEGIKILHSERHARKLKRGVLTGNKFKLRIREWCGNREKTIDRLQTIKTKGVPNYFGLQRFGIAGQNINKAMQMFKGMRVKRHQRSLYLSSVRSFLFNLLLSRRVEMNKWDKTIAGDVLIFDNKRSYFKLEKNCNEDIYQRLIEGEIHPSGVLWGKGKSALSDNALALEENIIYSHPQMSAALESAGLEIDRRALRMNVSDLEWDFVENSQLELGFFLPAGSYATVVLREIIEI